MYWLAAVERSSHPVAQWNWEAALQTAGQFSSDILSLNFTVRQEKKGEGEEGVEGGGWDPEGRVEQVGMGIGGTTATITKQLEIPTIPWEQVNKTASSLLPSEFQSRRPMGLGRP